MIALQHMAKEPSGHLFSAKGLAHDMKVPFDPLSRVMQKLAKNKIIRSEQGPAGGYELICNFSQVSLYDLIKIIQGPLEIVRCLGEQEACDLSNSCELKSPVSYLNEQLIFFYQKMTLQELFSQTIETKKNTEAVVL